MITMRMGPAQAQTPDGSARPADKTRAAESDDVRAAQQLVQHAQDAQMKAAGEESARRTESAGSAAGKDVAVGKAGSGENGLTQAEQEAMRRDGTLTRGSSQEPPSEAQCAPLGKAPVSGQVCR